MVLLFVLKGRHCQRRTVCSETTEGEQHQHFDAFMRVVGLVLQGPTMAEPQQLQQQQQQQQSQEQQALELFLGLDSLLAGESQDVIDRARLELRNVDAARCASLMAMPEPDRRRLMLKLARQSTGGVVVWWPCHTPLKAAAAPTPCGCSH